MKRKKAIFNWCVTSLLALGVVKAQFGFEEEEEGYQGRFIGSFNSYHHQVNGKVYAVDEYTILIKDFVYDGNGEDTFFWAGGSNRPGPQGFIVPDEAGRTNVLKRYLNDLITITLPDKKRVTDIKWFAVYDLSLHDAFGDVFIPEDFEPPGNQILSDIFGRSNGVRAESVVVMDSKTIKLEGFSYDGLGGDVYFWVGIGPQPSSKGHQVPDELGYFSPLRKYDQEDVYLQLPGESTVFDIRWFAIYDKANKRDLGHLIIPDGLNVPPSLVDIVHHETTLPNCEMLHSNLLIAWSTFAPSITIELAAMIDENDYIGFGVSGEQGKSVMLGADAAIAYIDGYLGLVDDYNITAKSPCSGVLGVKRGVCRDNEVKGNDNNQIQTHARKDGVTTITYRRTLATLSDPGDLPLNEDGETSIIWALGRLARNGRNLEPSFHHTYPKQHVKINFARTESQNNCKPFTKDNRNKAKKDIWGPFRIFDPTLRSFDARLGPSGLAKGYSGTTGLPSVGLAWYINGYMTPELYLRRGLTYAFRVEGGNDPYSPDYYHPFVITSDATGGFERFSDEQKNEVRILAGVEFTRRGVVRTTASGRLCLWKHRPGEDRRLDDNYLTFERYRNSLELECEEGEPAILEVTPNVTWPDVVYYQSFTHPYMGWKINVVDNFNTRYLLNGSFRVALVPGLIASSLVGLLMWRVVYI